MRQFSKSVGIALFSLLLVGAGTADAHIVVFAFNLSGASEAPPNLSAGIGSGFVTLDLDEVKMQVEATFSNLGGTVTAAHIHAATSVPGVGTAGAATPSFVNFPIGATAGSYNQSFDLTVASSYDPAFIASSGGTVSTALNSLIFAMEEQRAYLNIHTTAFPGGEVRGFLTAVPEPSSVVPMMFFAAAAAFRRRRAVQIA